jgi:SAM-dependent methyltransferase
VNRPSQTPESVQSDFDRIALLESGEWDHNVHYHRYLLSQVPERCRHALEIGCGAGEFSRLLAARAASVLAVDLSPRMIRLARERSALHPNVAFVNADALTCEFPEGHFDCVASVATLHHLPAADILRKIVKALKPGGVFVALDLYRPEGLGGLLLSAAAYPVSVLLRLWKTGRPRPPGEVREAYAAHGRTDAYLTLPQVAKLCAEVMPGARVRRHLLWRYSIIWKKVEL